MARIETLKQLRLEILAERNKLDAQLQKLEELIVLNQDTSPFAQESTGTRTLYRRARADNATPHSLSSPGIMQKAIAIGLELYDERQRPITTGEVLTTLVERGLQVGGQSPSGNVSSYLKHSSELHNIRGTGWIRKSDIARWDIAA